jgi:probable HAF family extracellular repeat protein
MQKPIGMGLLAVLVLAVGLPAVAQRYRITDLGTIQGSTYNWATGVNNLGHVVGCAGCSDLNTPAFLWTPQYGMQALPSLPSGGATYAYAINDSDQVAGLSYGLGESSDDSRAVIWSSTNAVQGLGTLPGGTQSFAFAINNLGQVTGTSEVDSGLANHAFLWASSTGMLDLQPAGLGSSWGFGVNSLGHVTGMFIGSNPRANPRAFYWTDQTGMQDLEVLPGWATSAGEGINDLDEIAGGLQGFQGKSIGHAVLWTQSDGRTRVKDLGTLPGGFQAFATALNNVGQVVGASDYKQSGGLDHAFVWSAATGMQDLNLLIPARAGWTLWQANGINDLGQITGKGTINQETHAFLLTPTQ